MERCFALFIFLDVDISTTFEKLIYHLNMATLHSCVKWRAARSVSFQGMSGIKVPKWEEAK
jgi:hypothetical protein